MHIRVSNVGRNITGESIRAVFATYGEVSSWSILLDGFTDRSIGAVFLEMPNDAEATVALSKIDGTVIDGCIIAASETKSIRLRNNG